MKTNAATSHNISFVKNKILKSKFTTVSYLLFVKWAGVVKVLSLTCGKCFQLTAAY